MADEKICEFKAIFKSLNKYAEGNGKITLEVDAQEMASILQVPTETLLEVIVLQGKGK